MEAGLRIRCRLGGVSDLGAPPGFRFARAARAGADNTVRLASDSDGVWTGVLPPISDGKWHMELGYELWRLTGPVRMPMSPASELSLDAPATSTRASGSN